MRSFEDRVHSFVIRVWQEPREIEGTGPEWRGRIEHVQSGERVYFRTLDRMVEFITVYLKDAGSQSSLLKSIRGVEGKKGTLQRLTHRFWPRG